MFCAVLSSCSCLCLNLADAVTGHSFVCPVSFPPHSHSCSKCHPLVSAAPSFSLHLAQPLPVFLPLPEKARRETSTFTPTIHFIFQDKQGIPWWLGISYKGIGQYDLQDKVKPRKVSFLHLCGFYFFFRGRQDGVACKNGLFSAPKENFAGTETVKLSIPHGVGTPFGSFGLCSLEVGLRKVWTGISAASRDNYRSMGFCKSPTKGLVLERCFHLAFAGIFCV